MTIGTTYPGVYIEELSSLSLSVSTSATAVPVFAVGTGNATLTTAVRISSWMDYENKRTVLGTTEQLDICLRTYFENGGGHCYLCPVANLIAEVPTLTDVTLLVAAGQDISTAVTQLCKPGDSRFAILDGPEDPTQVPLIAPGAATPDAEEEPANGKKTKRSGASAAFQALPHDWPHAAAYYPWLLADWTTLQIPPSAAMAGVYCRVDATHGVWKAPANVTLQGGVRPKISVTDEQQGRYTKGQNAINMLRVFDGGGTTVWGARTRMDNDNWRYIPVRRLFDAAERDIKKAMRTAMFEPNSQPTWEKTRAAIINYLHKLWRQGALAGATQEEAFFVHCGKGVTMDQTQIDQGEMIVKVGIAAVRPAEFIILQFTQEMAQ